MCGMYLFLAMLKANIGKAEKPVLAATAKIKAVDIGRRKRRLVRLGNSLRWLGPFGLELLPLCRNDTHPVIEEGNPCKHDPQNQSHDGQGRGCILCFWFLKERNRIGDGFNPVSEADPLVKARNKRMTLTPEMV